MKILVIRMSSLGDVILSTSFLETLPEGAKVDWIIASEFAFVLEGHPKIRRLIPFQKKTGLRGWLQLLKSLRSEGYDVRVDLHRTLRSTLGMILFSVWDLMQLRFTRSDGVSKERLRTWNYLFLKELTPHVFRPTPYWKRFAQVASRVVRNPRSPRLSPPSYLPMLNELKLSEAEIVSAYGLTDRKYFAVMPASRWRSKEWDPQRYLKLIEALSIIGYFPLLLGREKDPSCSELAYALSSAGLPYQSALREPDFKKTAVLLKHSAFYIGSDTGLAHLAEAVGTKSYILFGPTRPGLGFGPWRSDSKSISLPISCAPCSKDGKVCYRFFSPYECLKNLKVEQVLRELS